jgi:hypothetical protein
MVAEKVARFVISSGNSLIYYVIMTILFKLRVIRLNMHIDVKRNDFENETPLIWHIGQKISKFKIFKN